MSSPRAERADLETERVGEAAHATVGEGARDCADVAADAGPQARKARICAVLVGAGWRRRWEPGGGGCPSGVTAVVDERLEHRCPLELRGEGPRRISARCARLAVDEKLEQRVAQRDRIALGHDPTDSALDDQAREA